MKVPASLIVQIDGLVADHLADCPPEAGACDSCGLVGTVFGDYGHCLRCEVRDIADWESRGWHTSDYVLGAAGAVNGRSPRLERLRRAVFAEWEARYVRAGLAVIPAPAAADALTFDECERAGVDGSLRFGPYPDDDWLMADGPPITVSFPVWMYLTVDVGSGEILSNVVTTPNVASLAEILNEGRTEVTAADPTRRWPREATDVETAAAIAILDRADWPQVELQS